MDPGLMAPALMDKVASSRSSREVAREAGMRTARGQSVRERPSESHQTP